MMMFRYVVAASMVLGLHGASAQSDDADPIDRVLSACLNKPEGGSTAGMVECTDAATQAWDARLNRAYTRLMALMSDEAKTRLRTAQRQWIAYRDAMSQAYASALGGGHGTMIQLHLGTFYLDMVRRQALQLEGMLAAIEPR